MNWFDGIVIDELWGGHSPIWRIPGMEDGFCVNLYRPQQDTFPGKAALVLGGQLLVSLAFKAGKKYPKEHRRCENTGV